MDTKPEEGIGVIENDVTLLLKERGLLLSQCSRDREGAWLCSERF